MFVSPHSVAIDDAVFRAGFGADDDGFDEEVDITVSGTGVGAGGDEDGIAGNSGVDDSLDGVEICGAIVIDGDYCCLRRNRKEQANKSEDDGRGAMLKKDLQKGKKLLTMMYVKEYFF